MAGPVCVVDTSAWIEWLADSALGKRLGKRFADKAQCIVPTIVHALGFYQAWVQFGLIDTYAGLIAAHAVKGAPYVVIAVSASLANVDLRLEQAARNLGASVWQTLIRVIVPSARPGMLAVVDGGLK